jgi:drug/metabolite transporter (DMT)-like permease
MPGVMASKMQLDVRLLAKCFPWPVQQRGYFTVNKAIGIILIVIGLIGIAWGGFSYTTRETVVDIGPIHATREKTHNVPLPPIAGAVALVGGVVLLVAGKRA